MKKWMMAGVSATLVLSITLSACSDNGGGLNATDKTNQDNGKPIVTPAGTLPIVQDKATLKVLVTGSPSIDFPTSSATKWMEDKTNVHVEWEVAPTGKEAQAKLNVVLASGEYPDIIMNFGISAAQQLTYGKQGVFLPLNELIEKYGVEMKKNVLDKYPTVKDDITLGDGKIYSLPVITECYQCSMAQKMWIYKPWLDKLGLKMPTTTDEFYDVLKAFKEKDPNGNGKADEIPLAGAIEGAHVRIDEFLMNAFVLNNAIQGGSDFSLDNGQHLYVQNGKVVAAFNQTGWKEGLKYLRKLYAEKLLYPQTFTQNSKQYKALGENPDVTVLGAAASGGLGTFTQFKGPSGRWLQYEAVPPLKGPNGFQVTPFSANVTKSGEFVITKAAKHPEIAMRWADFMYSEEARWRLQKGEEGVNWRKPNPGEVGSNGKPAIYAQLKAIAEDKSNNNWYTKGIYANPDIERYSFTVDPKDPKDQATILYEATKNLYEPQQQKPDTMLPTLSFNEEQSKILVDLSKTIGTYVDESLARHVTGNLDIDKNWDSYLKQLDDLNLNKLLQIYQEAYDAKKKNK